MTPDVVVGRTRTLFDQSLNSLHKSTDRLFGVLMVIQYIGAVVWAEFTSPLTWSGSQSSIHPHVLTALVLGALITVPVALLTFAFPGRTVTRFTVAVCQMLMSALLIHVSGGRIETHFHVFGSLAFLSFYRDWRLLVPATLVVLVDHIVRGLYMPQSVYGVVSGAEWRFVEHACWVVFEDAILAVACVRSLCEMRTMAERQAMLESTTAQVEATVIQRTLELRQSESRKGAILENALDGIMSMNSHGDIIEFNPAAEAMFGYSREAAIGRNLVDLLGHPTTISEYKNAGMSPFLNNRVEIAALRSDGEPIAIELAVTELHLDETIFTGFTRDVSERKRLESELAHAQKMESVGRLAAGVAHEINTPNQYIGDNVRFLEESFATLDGTMRRLLAVHYSIKRGEIDAAAVEAADQAIDTSDLDYVLDEVPHAIGHALEGVERVASIIRSMKDFSHPGQASMTHVDVNRVIESTVTVARNEWKYFAKLDMELAPDLPRIDGHPGELGQVFLNLIVNSVHAIREKFGDKLGGSIRITSATQDNGVLLIFEDNGSGMPSDVVGRVFEPFYTTKGVGAGTGQGLAISHAVITEHHRGQIRCETSLGEGTTFSIFLPIESAAEAEAA